MESTVIQNDFSVLKEQDRLHHIHTSTNPVTFAAHGPTMLTKAEGIYIYTDDGRKIIDAGSGLSNVNIGYGNQRVCEAAYNAMLQLSFSPVAEGRTNPWAAALSAKLAKITPDSFQDFLFSSIGSDAIESSIKLAWHYWHERKKFSKRAIISRQHSYHGNTIMAASISGINTYQKQFGLPLEGVGNHISAPYSYCYAGDMSPQDFGMKCASSLEEKILELGPENVAAFIGEPIVAAVEMFIPPDSYWPEIRRICDKYDVLLINDEIITGFGKTGQLFGFQNFAYEPDIFVIAKGLSSGYFPISAVAVGNKVASVIKKSDEMFGHIFTNCGHPVGAAIALENISVIEDEKLIENVRNNIAPYLSDRLEEFNEFSCVGEVRSIGILGAIEIDTSKDPLLSHIDNETLDDMICATALERGLTMRASGLVLPMIVTTEQVDEIINILKASFVDVIEKNSSVLQRAENEIG